MTAPFIPPHPPRGTGPVPVWRGFVGERARNAVHGWSERAFTEPYIRRRVFGHNVHIPLTPDAVERVLLGNAANYVKPDLVKKLLKPTIGRGLLSSDGQLWRDQRKIVAANFAPAAIDALVPVFASAARRAMAGWTGSEDMAGQATQTTMRIIADALFAGDPRLTTQAAMDHITAALDGVSEARLQVLLGLPLMPWSIRGKRARNGQAYLRETLTRVVRDRLPGGGPDDFLGGLIRALHGKFADEDALALAVDNAATFYLAGHETTANAITWTLYLLSEQPALQAGAAAEAETALAAGEEDPALLDRLPLLRRILEESMRVYPPVPRFDRQAVADDELNGQPVGAGDIVSIWPWLLHRHHALWEEPDSFDPDRWRPEAKAVQHRFQYLPFGGGPRLCVGMRFATAEALTVLAHWLRAWSFAPTPGREVRASGMVTLRPSGGLPLVLIRR
ncbi:MAG TPA: cytochrome P450 [Allosphingosinicella sp.]|nr:cytochrome P450 [Allosphingosinicella sp.]